MGRLQVGFFIERWSASFCLLLAGLVFLSPVLIADAEKIPAGVSAQTGNDEGVPVLVGLNVPWQREDTLSEDAIVVRAQKARHR